MKKIEIPIDVIVSTLETMYFNFSSYLDNPNFDQQEFSWIVELINQYNILITYVPEEILYENKLTKIEL